MENQEVNKEFYTIAEFAKKLHVHINTIRRAVDNGRIQAVNIGSGKKRLYRIPKSEIERIALFNLETVIEKIIEKRAQEKK